VLSLLLLVVLLAVLLLLLVLVLVLVLVRPGQVSAVLVWPAGARRRRPGTRVRSPWPTSGR
jgi:hypothetical protein